MENFPAACAIVSASDLSGGQVLACSYLKHHPGARFYLLVVDTPQSNVDVGPGVHVIRHRELDLPYLSELSFKYSPSELCCALKPTLMHLLLTKYHEKQVIYFDADILVMRRMERLIECLSDADIVLTPHLLKPIPIDGLTPTEQDILIAGAYDLGFIAIRQSHSTQQFLQWWESRMRDGRFIESSQGLLTDQRWVDLVPSLFPTTLLRDETYNVGYWNIHSRHISRDGETFLVNGREPLTFFHFSGFDPAKPTIFSKHQSRTKIEKGTALADLIQLYVDLQLQNGFNVCRTQKYGFGYFDNGTAITAPIRSGISPGPKCSIIIPVYNRASLTRTCVDAVLDGAAVDFDYETIVADDASTDDTADLLKSYGTRIRVLSHQTNSGFAVSCNDAAAIATGEYLIFLNNDTIPKEGWLDALVRYAEAHPEASVVGSKLLFPNGTIQHAGLVICQDREPRHIYSGFPADDPLVNRSRRYQAVTGACLLVRKVDFVRTGGFDPGFRNGYEDVDLCLRLGEAGREVHYCHESVLYHFESASRDGSKTHDNLQNSKKYRERWAERVRPDEFDFYFNDGILKIEYHPMYPLAFSISPLLATLNGKDREHQADRLIHARAKQVIGLLKDNIHLTVRAREADFRLRLLGHDARLNRSIELGADAIPVLEPWIISRGQSLWLSDPTTNRLISIILPVKNGAAKLRKLLPALLSQRTRDLIEIIAVDSGSTDESVELLKHANATVLGIDPRTFNHGLTRTLATRYAHGEIYVFINQSTFPADEHWLANLIRPFNFDRSIAGVCGRILPRWDADWLNGKDIARNINASTECAVAKISDRAAYASLNPENLRKFINFHSLSAAIRADVFRQIPFREANFAEDLMWGKEALEAGFTIRFEPSSHATHSHNYSVMDVFRRNFDDGAACRKICGRTLEERDIVPAIMHQVRDDWRYLKEDCHLAGDDLDHWKLVSVMRRTAQLFGHWIGVHYESAEKNPAGLASIFSITEQIRTGAKTEQPEEFIADARSVS